MLARGQWTIQADPGDSGDIPQYSGYFLEKFLAVYNNSAEDVITALLEENLPPHLEALRKSGNPAVVQWPSLPESNNAPPPPPGMGGTSGVGGPPPPRMGGPPPGLHGASQPPKQSPAQPSSSLLSSRHNVFDGDQFDTFNNPAALDFSKIHINGKRQQTLEDEDDSARDFVVRNPTLNYEYDGYDDEYDDTYDGRRGDDSC